MRTITDEVGNRAVDISEIETDIEIGSTAEYATDDIPSKSTERNVAFPLETDRATDLENRRVHCELNPKGSTAQLGELVHTIDNGPDFKAANDNNAATRAGICNGA